MSPLFAACPPAFDPISRCGSNLGLHRGEVDIGASDQERERAHDSYGPLDIVTRNGCSYIAVRADPGFPADDGGGWMPLASRGAKGEKVGLQPLPRGEPFQFGGQASKSSAAAR